MENLREKLEIAANKTKKICNKKTEINLRSCFLGLELMDMGILFSFPDKEKPCKGASFTVIELKNIFRINVRCGYGKFNYAPCLEINKKQ